MPQNLPPELDTAIDAVQQYQSQIEVLGSGITEDRCAELHRLHGQAKHRIDDAPIPVAAKRGLKDRLRVRIRKWRDFSTPTACVGRYLSADAGLAGHEKGPWEDVNDPRDLYRWATAKQVSSNPMLFLPASRTCERWGWRPPGRPRTAGRSCGILRRHQA